jgi:hypothetical protein
MEKAADPGILAHQRLVVRREGLGAADGALDPDLKATILVFNTWERGEGGDKVNSSVAMMIHGLGLTVLCQLWNNNIWWGNLLFQYCLNQVSGLQSNGSWVWIVYKLIKYSTIY